MHVANLAIFIGHRTRELLMSLRRFYQDTDLELKNFSQFFFQF